jgi:predicted GNAT family N-acyltransferase
MVTIDFNKVSFRKLQSTDDLTAFNCTNGDDSGCNDFIHRPEEAKQYQKERLGITYLFFYEETMIGYITLAMSSIHALRLEEHEENIALPFYPCLFIGRLAVNNDLREKDIGTYLANWATGLALEMSEEIGCRYVVLESKESKIQFYSKIGFKKGASLFTDKCVWFYKKIAVE